MNENGIKQAELLCENLSLLTLKNDLDFQTSYMEISIENAKIIKLELNDLEEIRQKLYRKQSRI